MTPHAQVARKRIKEATGREPWTLTIDEFLEAVDPSGARWRIGYSDDETHSEFVFYGLIHDPASIPDSVLREYADKIPAAMNELIGRR